MFRYPFSIEFRRIVFRIVRDSIGHRRPGQLLFISATVHWKKNHSRLALFFRRLSRPVYCHNLLSRKTLRHLGPAQIGFVFSNRISEKCLCFGFPADERKLALNWLCFFAAFSRSNLYNSLLLLLLRKFTPPANWLCFFKLARILLTISTHFVMLSAPFGVFSHIFLIDSLQFLIFTLWFCTLHFAF